jgi:hypothetical protein
MGMIVAPPLHRRSSDLSSDLGGVSSLCRQVDGSSFEPRDFGTPHRFCSSIVGCSLFRVAGMVLRYGGRAAGSLRRMAFVRSGEFDQVTKDKLSAMGAWTSASLRCRSCVLASTIELEFSDE